MCRDQLGDRLSISLDIVDTSLKDTDDLETKGANNC